MCGRFDALVTWAFFNDVIYATNTPYLREIVPSVVRPTDLAPIIAWTKDGWAAKPAHFGLIPNWHKGGIKDFKGATFNARLETASEKPAFRDAFLRRHAIVPAEAFYEYSGPKGKRLPHRITRQDGQPLCMAGIWDRIGEYLSFAILTRPAGPQMQVLHDREPVILDYESALKWAKGESIALDAPVDLLIDA